FKNLSHREDKVVNLLMVSVIQQTKLRIPPCQTFDVNATTVQITVDPVHDQVLLFIKSNRVEYFVKNSPTSQILFDSIAATLNARLSDAPFDFRFQSADTGSKVEFRNQTWQLGVFLGITVGFAVIVAIAAFVAHKNRIAADAVADRHLKAQQIRQKTDQNFEIEQS
uniref:Uncharacterized protein n=1 Tax=Panagrolaimus sp. JU765 TaxID=591449 RepID=A0AC34RBG4_9BILA